MWIRLFVIGFHISTNGLPGSMESSWPTWIGMWTTSVTGRLGRKSSKSHFSFRLSQFEQT